MFGFFLHISKNIYHDIMIPFDKLFSWLFKSFNISGETLLIERLHEEWYQKFMIIKRSWIFALFMLWLPLCILTLSWVSIYIAYESITIVNIQKILIGGNIAMSTILVVSSINYIRHFRRIHHEPQVVTNVQLILDELSQWDRYFRSFFNWSITNQWILAWTIIIELMLIFTYGNRIGEHFWILTIDTLVIVTELLLLKQYRKRMTDLEMDYNILVQWKIFFVNQSGLLSTIQTIEWEKIKTVQSIFPSKIASFFNYGNIHILTEGDTAMIGTMSMFYVTNPDKTVALIQSFIDEAKFNPNIEDSNIKNPTLFPPVGSQNIGSQRHSLDTREKIRDVLR